MVDAAMAGVMFTADPVSGRRDRIVVDASAGLGEAVVSGLVTPDHYVLDRDARVVEFSAGRREVVVRSAAGGGVVHETHESGRGEATAGGRTVCRRTSSRTWSAWARSSNGTSDVRRT